MQAINSSSSPLYVLPFRLTVSERSKTFCGTFFTAVSLLMTMWFLTVIFSAILTGSGKARSYADIVSFVISTMFVSTTAVSAGTIAVAADFCSLAGAGCKRTKMSS